MPAQINSLHNKAGTIVYPETIISAVHMLDGKRTLDAAIEEFADDSSVTVFNNDGTITKTMTNSGMYSVTTFGDNVITEVCRYPDAAIYYTKTTTFNNDGSITVSKVYANNGG